LSEHFVRQIVRRSPVLPEACHRSFFAESQAFFRPGSDKPVLSACFRLSAFGFGAFASLILSANRSYEFEKDKAEMVCARLPAFPSAGLPPIVDPLVPIPSFLPRLWPTFASAFFCIAFADVSRGVVPVVVRCQVNQQRFDVFERTHGVLRVAFISTVSNRSFVYV
jgi:hypothetical protein